MKLAHNLPRLIGVDHLPITLDRIKKEIITPLPSSSTVGLERDFPFNEIKLPPKLEGILKNQKFFTELAEHSKICLHNVFFVETAQSHLTGLKESLQELGNDFERLSQISKESAEANDIKKRVLSKAIELSNIMNNGQTIQRSMSMNELILGKEWKPGDVVIVGYTHALHLSTWWQVPIYSKILNPAFETLFSSLGCVEVERDKAMQYRLQLKL